MYKVAVIVCSDSGARNERIDISGKVVSDIVQANGLEVAYYEVIPDDKQTIINTLESLVAANYPLILTSGGTGLSMRDVTPEATLAVVERLTPGVSEAMRAYSLSFTKRAMLSRAISGVKNSSWIINLPGSPKACDECLTYIMPEVIHGLQILLGDTNNCARK